MRKIADQIVVVVGGSSGIGRATAVAAGTRRAQVAIAARGESALAATKAEVEAAGSACLVVALDAADREAIDGFADRVAAEWGRIDTWVNAAGVSVYGGFADIPPAEFERVIAVNLFGVANGCRAAIRLMRLQPGGGTIVNVSSGLGDRAVPLQSAYCASKFAVNGLSEAIRMELAHEGLPIRLTVVKPASMDTPFFAHARSLMDAAPSPIPPVYDARLAADAILYAAEHPVRDLPVGGASAGLGILEGVAPRLIDAALSRVAYPLQKGDTISGPTPGNLWAGSPGPGGIDGGHGGRGMSVYTALRIKPRFRRIAVAAAALSGFAAARRGRAAGSGATGGPNGGRADGR